MSCTIINIYYASTRKVGHDRLGRVESKTAILALETIISRYPIRTMDISVNLKFLITKP